MTVNEHGNGPGNEEKAHPLGSHPCWLIGSDPLKFQKIIHFFFMFP